MTQPFHRIEENIAFLEKNDMSYELILLEMMELNLDEHAKKEALIHIKKEIPFTAYVTYSGLEQALILLPKFNDQLAVSLVKKILGSAEVDLQASIFESYPLEMPYFTHRSNGDFNEGSTEGAQIDERPIQENNEENLQEEIEIPEINEENLQEELKTPADQEQQPDFVSEDDNSVQHKLLNITIIDDEEVIRSFLTDQLEASPWGELEVSVEAFREGESFFESNRLEKEGKHIVILDGIMPRMDGLEVLNKIRQSYSEERVSVIMVTSRSREQDIVAALEDGAFDYVTKPFKIHELIARIKRIVQRM